MNSVDNNFINLCDIKSDDLQNQELFWNVVVSRNLRKCLKIECECEISESQILNIIKKTENVIRKQYPKDFIQFLGYVSLGFDSTKNRYIYNIYILFLPVTALIELKKNGIKNIKIFIVLDEDERKICVLSGPPLSENIAIVDRNGVTAPYETPIICIE